MNLRTYPVKIRVKLRNKDDRIKYDSNPLLPTMMMEATNQNEAECKTISFIESYLQRFNFGDAVQVKAGKRQRRIFPNGTVRATIPKKPKLLAEIFGGEVK